MQLSLKVSQVMKQKKETKSMASKFDVTTDKGLMAFNG